MAAMSKINSLNLNQDSLLEVFEQLRKKILKEREEREETERARATAARLREMRINAARDREMLLNDMRALEIHHRQLVLPHYIMRDMLRRGGGLRHPFTDRPLRYPKNG
jgi:hypothetical protein